MAPHRSLLVALAATVLALCTHACECPGRSTCEILDQTPMAVIGTVVGVERWPTDSGPVVFLVNRTIKGDLEEGVRYSLTLDIEDECSLRPVAGEVYAFLFTVDEAGILQASICDLNQPLSVMNDDDLSIFLGYPETCRPETHPCAEGVERVACLVNPCTTISCPSYPLATCSADYCGGCIARFYNHSVEVTSDCTPFLNTAKCPAGLAQVQCLQDPCQLSSCNSLPDATCRANYCGGCRPEFIHQGLIVTDICSQCSVGVPQVNCEPSPCATAQCSRFPNATCRADSCGGCYARFFVDDVEVTGQCSECPPDQPLRSCFADPCQYSLCPAHPDATCLPNYCGGCNAKYYVNGSPAEC